MGFKDVVAIYRILKGMGTSPIGMAGTVAWAITKAMLTAGLEISDPESGSKWLGEWYDIVDKEVFGKYLLRGEC